IYHFFYLYDVGFIRYINFDHRKAVTYRVIIDNVNGSIRDDIGLAVITWKLRRAQPDNDNISFDFACFNIISHRKLIFKNNEEPCDNIADKILRAKPNGKTSHSSTGEHGSYWNMKSIQNHHKSNEYY